MGRVRSRKAVVVSSALASRLVLCLIVLLPYMMPFPAALKAILGAAFLWGALGSVASNAWTGWMSDLVPRRIRGRYFSSGNFALMLASIVSSLLLSWFLDQFSEGAPQRLLAILPSLRGRWIFLSANKMAAFTLLYMLGAMWTGYGIAMGNLLLLFGTARTKEMFFAVYATSSALTIFVGSLVSGYIVTLIPATYLGPLRLNSVQVIFLFTSILRLISVFAAARLIVEAGSRGSTVVVRDVLARRLKR